MLPESLQSITCASIKKNPISNQTRVFEVGKASGIQISHKCKHPLFLYYTDKKKSNAKTTKLPGVEQLDYKDLLSNNLNIMINKFGADEFDFMPLSYVLPIEYRKLEDAWNTSNAWISKPPQVKSVLVSF